MDFYNVIKWASMMRRISFFQLCVFLIFGLSGCASQRASLEQFNMFYGQGDVCSAQAVSRSMIRRGDNPADLLWNLQMGLTAQFQKQFAQSNAYFNTAERSFRYYDLISARSKVAQTGGSLFGNDTFLPYQGKNYDRIMVNVYKGLNFCFLNDHEKARVEFNRAIQRQNDAKERFGKEIALLDEQLRQQQQGLSRQNEYSVDLKASIANDRTRNAIEEKYQNLFRFQAYPDFVNPFATYISGLFFLLNGDYAKATDLLKQAHGMVPGNTNVAKDFIDADQQVNLTDQLWVIFENGLGPIREEMRIDIPLFILPDVKYVGIVLPTLKQREEAYQAIRVGGSVKTEIIGDMDRIILTEFQKEFNLIMTREIARLLLKTYAQYMVSRKWGQMVGLGAAAWQLGTAAADLRIWSSLPKNFQVARVTIPEERRVMLEFLSVGQEGNKKVEIPVPSCNNCILYIKSITSETQPVYDFIVFD